VRDARVAALAVGRPLNKTLAQFAPFSHSVPPNHPQKNTKKNSSDVRLYEHARTGAQVISVVNTDENKTFGAVLRTPVDDSKGVPHILEHSVLCGSRKYAIKEPFVELMKGSLNTFLNAFTYPDRTCYPVASANLADFYNLVDVYLDAVLHPACVADPRTFAQEGWHYEVEDKEGGDDKIGSSAVPASVRLKGVVFNEMKGVYSSPDAVHGRAVQQALFPDNTYAADSGGDPAAIPDLTFDEFAAFHARFYHPSNARFWFYGDDPPEERLRRLGAYLDEFEKRDATDSEVSPQPLFNEPRRVVAKYAASAAEDGEGTDAAGASPQKEFVSLNWVLAPDAVDLETELALGFLDYLLLGTSAAPLRKALNDSGLGEALIGGGLQDELRQPIFSVGLKGVAPGDAPKVEALIMDELRRLASEGFPSSAVEAAVNTIEFSLRENNTGSFPRGLSLMLRAAPAWIYGRDPVAPLQWEADLAHLKGRLAAGEDVFRPLIARFLVDNPHRVAVTLQPDPALGPAQEAAEQARVDAAVAAMGPAGLAAAAEETAALRERQETPDPPAALACIPSLALSDIPKAAPEVPTDLGPAGPAGAGATLLAHDLPTSGVLYVEACLPLERVPARLLPLVPLFSRCLTQMGTATESFVELTDRIGRKTGGLSVSPLIADVRGKPSDPASFLIVSGKAMADKAGDLFDLASDILLTARLDDRDRFRQMVLETRAGLEAGVVGAGHRFAARRLDAPRSVAGWAGDAMGGLAYLDFIRDLAKRVDDDAGWAGVAADLEAIRAAVLGAAGAVVNATADGRTLELASPLIDSFLGRLPGTPTGGNSTCDWAAAASTVPNASLALTVPTQVNYVGKAANLYEDGGYKLTGAAYVASKVLGTSWLWDRVRVSGGAYGGFADFDSHSGQFTYLSYRDPNLLDTLDVYDGTPGWLKSLDLDADALTKAIIGTVGDIDAYQLPDAKGHAALMRHLLGVTQAERQQRRDEVLGTSLADVRAFGDAVACVSGPAGRVVAVTNADRAAAALAERPGVFDEVIKVL
jgi:presequence protease